MKNTRSYITRFYKKDGKQKASYHKHLKSAKTWKTKKGVENSLNKYIENSDKDINNFTIIEKTNSELGLVSDNEKVDIKKPFTEKVIKEEKVEKENKIIYFFKNIIKYIKEEIKLYFPK
jgi:hypothetical protein